MEQDCYEFTLLDWRRRIFEMYDDMDEVELADFLRKTNSDHNLPGYLFIPSLGSRRFRNRMSCPAGAGGGTLDELGLGIY